MKTKWNLTKSEQRAYSENAERLKSGGVAIGVEKTASSESPQLTIEQSEHSVIHAGTSKGMAFELWLRVIPLKSGITLLDDCHIIIPVCDADIELVQPPEVSLRYRPFGWLDIETGNVLNHLIFNGRPLPRGKIFDGIVVAQSFDPLPSQFQTGMRINATICLIDQSDKVYRSAGELRVVRHAQDCQRPKNATGLFGPKQVFGTRYEHRVHEYPTSVIGKTVSTVKGNAIGPNREASSDARQF